MSGRVIPFPVARMYVADVDHVAPARQDPAPFEVRIRFGVGDVAELIGYGRNGDPVAELRVPLVESRRATSRIVSEFKAFVRVIDELEWDS